MSDTLAICRGWDQEEEEKKEEEEEKEHGRHRRTGFPEE